MFRYLLLAGSCIACTSVTLAGDGKSLSLRVLHPPYRQSIYATQSAQPIVVHAEMADAIRTRAIEVHGRLLDEHGKQRFAVRLEPKAAAELRFDGKTLPVGTYAVEVRIIGEGGRELATEKVVIRKLAPSPGSEVRIDEHRNIVIDGQPSVQIGWYGGVRLDDPRPAVLALQNLQTAIVVHYPDKTPVSRMFGERNIRTMVNLEPGRLLYTFDLWKQPNHPVPTEHKRLPAPSARCREMLRKVVELLRDEPGLFGWYIADEPEINDYRADYLEAYYRTIRELDPYHPVVVTNDTLDGIEKFGFRCCDILSPDPYRAKPGYVPSFLNRANSVLQRGQGLMLTPWHAAHHTHFTPEYGTQPPFSYRVMRGQYLATLAAGGRGFTGYASAFFLPEPRLRIGLPRLWREVRFLEPVLQRGGLSAASSDGKSGSLLVVETGSETETTKGRNKAKTDRLADTSSRAKDVLAWIGKDGELVTLIVMNAADTARELRVYHPALTMPRIAVVSEAREVAIDGGTFVDTIPAGEACVYSTDPRGWKLPTVTQIEREIGQYEKSSAKPGNLLHASRGVKARASQGTTPWFAHIFYYAINGIVDDEGWHVTHAKLPQWIEFALPEVTPLRRVVLYTPNLRDYDLQFRGVDGSIQQAEVRGNTRDVAEHVLARPVPTLKLRLVARTLQPNADPPRAMAREVEAYADARSQSGEPLTLAAIEAPVEPADEAKIKFSQTPPLWRDDFSSFTHKPKHYEGDAQAWVLNPDNLVARYDAKHKWLACTVTGPAGYASMGRLMPCSPEHRFLQISVPKIEGEGYRWLNVGFGDPSGKARARSAVHTIKPGRYTADTHALHDIFRSPDRKRALLRLYLMKGINYALQNISLVAQPVDGLAITMADGTPLPRSLKTGDELLLRLFLEQPATDAIVELFRDSNYAPVRINGEPYVQLLKSGKEKDGRYWSAVVKLGPKTDRFKVTSYPVLFRAIVTGGAVKETLSTVVVDFL